MKELKNIDRLFQEKFRDFEQTPPPHIWKNVSASIAGKTKKDNRALWLWFSGIAAGLALLFLLNNLFIQTDKNEPHTTDTNDSTIIKVEPSNLEVTHTKTAPIIDKLNNNINTSNQKQNIYSNNTTITTTTIIKKKKSGFNNNLQKEVTTHTKSVKSNSTITYPVIKKIELVKSDKNKSIDHDIAKAIIQNNNKIMVSEELGDKQTKPHSKNKEQKSQEVIATNNSDIQSKTLLEETLSKITNNDDISISTTPKKWIVSTTIAPVYFDTFDGNTSSFGEKFDTNTKQGQFSTAYGVQLAYQVNDRFSVQTGLHKVDYGYKTNEVYVSPNKFADNSESTIILDDIININSFHAPPNQFGVETKEFSSGSLLQVFGYYEIPVELKYQLVKGKIGLDIVSGFSTLIRTKDEIYYQIDNFSEKIAATSNLNPVNLTGNIGLEANYKINKKVSFNITPMFKVHANTFTKEAGKSNPYAIGVYSGLNYRF